MDPEESQSVSRLDAFVLAYEDALRQGRVPWQLALGPPGMDAGQAAEFQALQGCLRKLERA